VERPLSLIPGTRCCAREGEDHEMGGGRAALPTTTVSGQSTAHGGDQKAKGSLKVE
jgi:hypothetical protein